MKVIKGNINSVKGFKSYGSAVGLKKRKKDIEAELEKKESYSEQISSCKETIEKMDKKLKAGKK